MLRRREMGGNNSFFQVVQQDARLHTPSGTGAFAGSGDKQ
jgi:hypothetical protein